MTDKAIIIYLNDHLAGSVAALELVDYLLTLHQEPDRYLLMELRGEIEEDQKVLQRLLADLGGKESQVRKAAAWLTEKLGQAKLRLDHSGNGDLRVLEALETLGLGIQGKLSLWRALTAVAQDMPQLSGLNLPQLQARAAGQFNRVDGLRLQVARTVLSR
jgi:hypothetical protein